MDGANDQVDSNGLFFGGIFSNSKSKKEVQVPTYKKDVFYNTNHKRRGLAVIFNHENFTIKKLRKRIGTEDDCVKLEATLKSMGFVDVKKYKDLTKKELDAVIGKLSKEDFSDCDCLFIAVLSHGDQGVIYAKDDAYTQNMLIDRFAPDKCPTLAGKPKIYVIQACQGDKCDPGIEVRTVQVDSDADNNNNNNDSIYRLPLYADFLIAYSTIPGYFSWRNPSKGSWYIQALCEELDCHWQDVDFLTILTLVNRRVAVDFESYVPHDHSMDRKKQIPSFLSMLTRILKFTPKTN